MATTTPRNILYSYPDGPKVVFSLRDFAVDACMVRESWVEDLDDRYVDLELPDDLEEKGREIPETEAKKITGYFKPADLVLEDVRLALCRLAPGDAEKMLNTLMMVGA